MNLSLRKIFVAALILLAGSHVFSQRSEAVEDARSEAKLLLEIWLTCQNTGNLTIYRTLYADDFMGVRKSGSRTVTLDLNGWIKDRTRMFKSRMNVSISDVRIKEDSEGVHLIFTQNFKQGSYQDVGLKRMLLSRSSGRMKIEREEMLNSDLIKASPQR
jgi:hypothetical protein